MSNINELVYFEAFNAKNDLYINHMVKNIQLRQAQRKNFMNSDDVKNKYSPEVIHKVLDKFANRDRDALKHAVITTKLIYQKAGK